MNETRLAFFPKLTFKRYKDLERTLGSFENIWNANETTMKNTGWDTELIQEFLHWRDAFDIARTAEELNRANIEVIELNDPSYPSLLKQIYDPPLALFVQGKFQPNELYFAVVGTRKCSAYGAQVAEELTAALARYGVTIVSGLALGIDGIAHETTLKNQGRTVAVLGSGIDRGFLYPPAHCGLADRIVAGGGAVISEYPPKTESTGFSFPRRNRIIAGMCVGTLVIEAPASSGALITAQCALDNGREVFAVPQNITYENAAGPNNLIKAGAHPVTCADDIVDILNLQSLKRETEVREIIPSTPTEALLLPLLSREPIHVDQLTKQSKLASPTVASALTIMEIKGMVRNLGGMMYVVVR